MSYKFSKKERLKGKKEIDRLFKENNSIFVYPFKVFYTKNHSSEPSPPKVLFSVPKKKIRKAYQRNYIKRQTRESYRLQKNILLNQEGLFTIKDIALIYIANEKKEYQFIEKKIKKILVGLSKI